jgi:hypothetical protein
MLVLIICTTRRQRSSIYSPDGSLRSLCGELGLPRNSKLGTPEAEVPTLDKWILEKREIQCISLVSKAVVLIQLHKRKT